MAPLSSTCAVPQPGKRAQFIIIPDKWNGISEFQTILKTLKQAVIVGFFLHFKAQCAIPDERTLEEQQHVCIHT
jgi:hypothetical protein